MLHDNFDKVSQVTILIIIIFIVIFYVCNNSQCTQYSALCSVRIDAYTYCKILSTIYFI